MKMESCLRPTTYSHGRCRVQFYIYWKETDERLDFQLESVKEILLKLNLPKSLVVPSGFEAGSQSRGRREASKPIRVPRTFPHWCFSWSVLCLGLCLHVA
ncbi:hypothetical protein Tco_0893721 [Tanacetum coccineum]|uniref:Uncharacterized protein n=1 Tax=Tanacetum coccineum TaxID=301880 RepID=A0ABQ5CFZ9_9ASTR